MCHPECISTLQLVAAHLHDQATTSKEIQRPTETPLPPPPVSCYFMVQSCYSGTNPNFNL